MRKNITTEVQIKHGTTAGELARLLAKVPANATMTIRQEKYHSQFDAGGTWVKFSWNEEL